MGVLVVNAANTPHLLPWPQKVEWTKSDFRIRDVALSVPDSLSNKFSDWVTECGGTVNQKSSRVLKVVFVTKLPAVQVNPEEAYRLTISSSLITIEAVSGKGVYWALQTLRQLTVKKGEYTVVAGCEITDWPAFRVRGFMQDARMSISSKRRPAIWPRAYSARTMPCVSSRMASSSRWLLSRVASASCTIARYFFRLNHVSGMEMPVSYSRISKPLPLI